MVKYITRGNKGLILQLDDCSMEQVEERGVDMFYLPHGMQKNDVVKIFKVEDEDDLKKQLGLQ